MQKLRSLRLSIKLPLFVVTVCIALATALTVATDQITRKKALESAEFDLMLAAKDRTAELERFLGALRSDLLPMRSNPSTIDALQSLRAGWMSFQTDAQEYLTKTYVDDSPFPIGQKQNLDRGADPLVYNFQHEKFHPFLREFQESKGYYDLFLINLEGDIIYSVFKEADFASNLDSGAYSDSPLARAFRSARDGTVGEMFLSDFAPYAPSNGAEAAFAATIVTNKEGDALGVLAVQLNTNALDGLVNDRPLNSPTFISYLVGEDMTLRSTTLIDDGPRILDPVTHSAHIAQAIASAGPVLTQATGLMGQPTLSAVIPVNFGGRDWAVVTEDESATITARADVLRDQLIVLSLIISAVACAIGWFYVHTITTAITGIGTDMVRMSEGDYESDVDAVARNDEIGDIGRVLLDFRDRLHVAEQGEHDRAAMQAELQRVVDVLSEGLVNLSDGDFSSPIQDHFHDDYEKLRADFNETISRLSGAINEVLESARSIKHGAVEITDNSDDLSKRTETQASTLEQTATALDELTLSVKTAAESAKSVENIVTEACTEANSSGQVVRDAVEAMSAIEESSSRISKIIGVIEDIAFQTNLLALNAGVEAARAGDAGRGFAVVASEVRALAQRSSEAAKEIKTLIGGSSEQVGRGVDLVGKAGDALGLIVERVAHISTLTSEMATEANQQATGINEINIGVTQLGNVTQQNAAMVQESTAASHNLNRDAEKLLELMDRFRTESTKAIEVVPLKAADAPLMPIEEIEPPVPDPAPIVDQVPPTAETPKTEFPKEEPAQLTASGTGWQDF